MSVAVEVLSGLQRRIKVSIPSEEMARDYQKKLNEYKKNIKIKGFRPGKVPANVIEQRYGKSIRQEVRDESLRKSLTEAIEQNDLTIVGMPDIQPQEWNVGEGFEFEAECEVYPTINVDDLSSLKATKYNVNVSDPDVDEMLGSLADQNTEWSTVERAAADGDKVVIDFTGTINGEAFEGGHAHDFEVQIGAKHMIPGFEEGLIGIEAGVARELKLVFPEDYHAKEVAGQSVEFAVTAKEVKEPTKPEINEDFAKKIGFTAGLDALRSVIVERLEKEASSALLNHQKESILEQLVAANEVELPQQLVDTEVKYLQQAAKQQAVAKGEVKAEEAEETTFPAEDHLEQAKHRVLLGLVLSAIVKKFEIKVDQMAVRQRVEQIATGYPKPQELIQWLYQDRSRLAEIETAVLEDQAIERILDAMDGEPEAIEYQAAVKMIQDAQKEQSEEKE
jgi:trigger factor